MTTQIEGLNVELRQFAAGEGLCGAYRTESEILAVIALRADLRALLAERDKLAGEVERLGESMQMYARYSALHLDRAEVAEAKLAALDRTAPEGVGDGVPAVRLDLGGDLSQSARPSQTCALTPSPIHPQGEEL